MTVWNVGDLVVFNENNKWVGGKGEVVDPHHYDATYSVRVKMLETPPELSDLTHLVGKETNHRPTDLLPYKPKADAVNHPSHYGGKDDPYEVIKVAEAWGFDKDSYLFNVLKYIARAGKKGSKVEDLEKGVFYLQRKIKRVKEEAK